MTILQLKTFITQATTNTRALIYFGLYVSLTERINNTAFTYPACDEKSSNS